MQLRKIGWLWLVLVGGMMSTSLLSSQDQTPPVAVPEKTPALPDLMVRGEVLNPEVVGDEYAQIRLDILLRQGSKINWELLNNPKVFLPFSLGEISVQEKGVPLDDKLKDYNLFEVQIFLALPIQPPGVYQSNPWPLEYVKTDFTYAGQEVKERRTHQRVGVEGFTLRKVLLRATLDAEQKSLEIGDQYEAVLTVIHDPKVRVLNWRYQANTGKEPEEFLDRSKFAGQEVLGVTWLEQKQNAFRSLIRMAFRLTSFELPPKELSLGPLAVLYQLTGDNQVKNYTTNAVAVKLNSVLRKDSALEGVRSPTLPTGQERWWLTRIPYWTTAVSVSMASLLLLLTLTGWFYRLRHKPQTVELLPIQRMLLRRSRVPFFIWHWLILGLLWPYGSKSSLEKIIYRFRLCWGSAVNLPGHRALTITVSGLSSTDQQVAEVLSWMETILFEDHLVLVNLEEYRQFKKVYRKLAYLKVKFGLSRLFRIGRQKTEKVSVG